MARVSRIMKPSDNRIRASGVTLTPSSQVSSLPVGFLRDQLPSKVLKFREAWTISSTQNDRIDWNRGGGRVATITAGYYGTGAELAAEVQTRMQAADGGATYTVTYDASTHKFTIACNLSITILWLTGANVTRGIGKSLGYDVTADDTGTSNVADFASYQSTHFIKADLGSAQSTQVGIVWNHNAGTGGTFTHQANATDAWTAPTVSQVLAGDADIRIGFFGLQTLRWRRLEINDVSNPLGYSEIGIWYDGPYVQPTFNFSDDFVNDPEELSALGVAIGGAHFVDRRPIRGVYSIVYREVPTAQLTVMQAIEADTPKGTNFFFAFDAVDTPADTLYGYRAGPMRQAFVPHDYWDISFPFAEALE